MKQFNHCRTFQNNERKWVVLVIIETILKMKQEKTQENERKAKKIDDCAQDLILRDDIVSRIKKKE